MIDLADFEGLVFTLFDAQGDEDKLISDASVLDQQIQLQRCLAVHHAKFSVARYYCQVRDGKDPELAPQQDAYVAIVRVDYNSRLVLLNAL